MTGRGTRKLRRSGVGSGGRGDGGGGTLVLPPSGGGAGCKLRQHAAWQLPHGHGGP